jgi:hypothetical protein
MNQHAPTSHDLPPEDIDLVATWLVTDKARWAAGVAAGLFAGLLAMGFAGVLAVAGGMEFMFPVKLMGTAIVGPSATELGAHLGAVLAGLVVVEALAAFWGFVYAHFVKTNALGSLLAMGLVWGVFGWIFHWNLYFHSIKSILASNVSPGAAFPVFLIYGLSLTSVAFFDRAFKGGR